LTLFLLERGRLSRPLLYLSSYIKRHRNEYYELLQLVRTQGDNASWLRFFLTAVKETAEGALRQADSLLALRDDNKAKLGSEHRAVVLLDELFINPYITVARAAERLGVSPPTADKTIAHLVKAGMLEEVTGRTWGRTWVAKPILRAIQDQPTDNK
jgi:Fic family protein